MWVHHGCSEDPDDGGREQGPGAREAVQAGRGRWLYLEVTPTGAKCWRWKYGHAGKEKRVALGVFPEITLADARGRRDEERARLRDGVDPLARGKADKLALTQQSEI